MLRCCLTLSLLLFPLFTHSLDLQFRFKDGFCQKAGAPGFNPEFFGECGNITGSKLVQRISQGDNLRGGIFNSNYIYVSQFNDGDLNHSSFRRAIIMQTDFNNMKTQSMDIRASQIKGVRFLNCKMHRLLATAARFNRVSFESSDLSEADFWGSQLLEVNFKNADLRGANFTASFVLLSDFTGAKFNDSTKLPFSEETALKKGMVKVD